MHKFLLGLFTYSQEFISFIHESTSVYSEATRHKKIATLINLSETVTEKSRKDRLK